MTEHIAFCGKGGAGTTTVVSNISAALVEAGFRVLQIGCGLKGNSSAMLGGVRPAMTVWDQYLKDGLLTFDSVVNRGFKGTYFIELGSPEHDQSSTATSQALGLLLKFDLITSLSTDFVLYDISGDLASGVIQSLSAQIRLHRIFAVLTADVTSLTTVNELMVYLKKIERDPLQLPFGGLLPNIVANSFEESFVADFAKHTGVHTLVEFPAH